MVRIGLPVIIFAGIQGVFKGYLQSELRFTESAAAQFPFNFTYILFLLFLANTFGIKGLMVTSVIAVASQIVLQVPGVKNIGYRYKYILNFKDTYIKRIFYLIPPLLISSTIDDINKIIDRSMASTLIEGSISSLQYASRLNGLVSGTFISAIATVLFPILSQEANEKNYDGLKRTIIHGFNIIILITIPAAVGMIILAKPIVKLAFQRGAFGENASFMTMGALIFYSMGLVGTSLRTMLDRVYYSLQDTRTPMINSFITLALNVALNLVLINTMAHRGLALATSISITVTSLCLLIGLRNRIGPFGFMRSVKCGFKALTAATVMGIVVFFLGKVLIKGICAGGTLKEPISLLITSCAGVFTYSILIYLLRVKEIDWIIKIIKDRLTRGRR